MGNSKTAIFDPEDGLPPFRLGVGLVVLNKDGDTLCCERSRERGAWQWPQGGIDAGETPLNAAWRELYEECGLSEKTAKMLGQLPVRTEYIFPDHVRAKHAAADSTHYSVKYRGQMHEWFIFQLTGSDQDIHFAPDPEGIVEFSDWAWWSADKMCAEIVPFKKDVYCSVAQSLAELLENPLKAEM